MDCQSLARFMVWLSSCKAFLSVSKLCYKIAKLDIFESYWNNLLRAEWQRCLGESHAGVLPCFCGFPVLAPTVGFSWSPRSDPGSPSQHVAPVEEALQLDNVIA